MKKFKTSNILLFTALVFVFVIITYSLLINGAKQKNKTEVQSESLMPVPVNNFSNILIDGNIEVILRMANDSKVFVNDKKYNDYGIIIENHENWLHINASKVDESMVSKFSVLVHCNNPNELIMKNNTNCISKYLQTDSLRIEIQDSKLEVDSLFIKDLYYAGKRKSVFNVDKAEVKNFQLNMMSDAKVLFRNSELNLAKGVLKDTSQVRIDGNVFQMNIETTSPKAQMMKY